MSLVRHRLTSLRLARVRRLMPVLIVGACLAWSHHMRADGQVTVTDLGTLGGSSSEARAINDKGQIVGTSDTPGDASAHAFLWTAGAGMVDLGGGSSSSAIAINSSGQVVGSDGGRAFSWTADGGMVDLGTLGGSSSAIAVNDAGQIAGSSFTPGNASRHPFLWTADTGMVDLGTLGGENCFTHAINSSGQIVGECNMVPGGPMHAFLWTAAGGMIDLGTLGGSRSFADFINDSGQVAGESWVDDTGVEHAFVWTAANGMYDLGTLGGNHSQVEGINASGQVTGTSTTANAAHAFTWDPQTRVMVDLGALGASDSYSFARAINASGQIVGFYGPVGADQRPFSWTAASGMLDLGTLGGSFGRASAVNSSGVVAGQAQTASGALHAVIWNLPNTPVGTDVAVQPVDTATGTTPVSVAFSAVTQAGSTTLTTSSIGPAPPTGFTLGNPAVYYDLTTTAGFSPPVTVCINYAGIGFTGAPALFHFENSTWVDRTATVDAAHQIICAGVTSLSPFAIFQPRVPKTKDDCKNGGWQTLRRRDGTSFKNQGSCVSYVNAGR